MSSLSGFSTNSHLDEGAEEGAGGGAKEDKSHPDPFSSAGSSTRDPFAAFTLPTSDANSFGGSSSGRSFSGKPSDLSAFDPFGSGTSNFDPFKVSWDKRILLLVQNLQLSDLDIQHTLV